MGKSMNPHIRVRLSRSLAKLTDAENGDCFRNAVRAMGHLGNGPGEIAYYVEGFAATWMVAEHGWLEVWSVRPHKLLYRVDCTPCYCAPRDIPVRGYFPVAKYSVSDVFHRVQRKGATVPFHRLWITDEDAKTAYSAAHKAAYGLTLEEMHAKLRRTEEQLVNLSEGQGIEHG